MGTMVRGKVIWNVPYVRVDDLLEFLSNMLSDPLNQEKGVQEAIHHMREQVEAIQRESTK